MHLALAILDSLQWPQVSKKWAMNYEREGEVGTKHKKWERKIIIERERNRKTITKKVPKRKNLSEIDTYKN